MVENKKQFRGNRRNERRGNLMILVLVVVSILGVIGTQLSTETEARSTRSREEQLRHVLARIRNAFDLKKKLDPTYAPDLSTPALISLALQKLVDDKLLGNSDLRDPVVLQFQWKSSGDFFWKGTTNVSFNSSFESDALPDPAKSEVVASWSLGDLGTGAASDTRFFPSKNTDELDDYRFQNKFGGTMTASGTSLRVDN